MRDIVYVHLNLRLADKLQDTTYLESNLSWSGLPPPDDSGSDSDNDSWQSVINFERQVYRLTVTAAVSYAAFVFSKISQSLFLLWLLYSVDRLEFSSMTNNNCKLPVHLYF